MPDNLEAVVVTCAAGRIRSICLEGDEHYGRTLGLVRFRRWCALHLKVSPEALEAVTIVIEGEDLEGVVLHVDRPIREGNIFADLENDSLGDRCVSPEQRRAAEYFRDLDIETASAHFYSPHNRLRGDGTCYRADKGDKKKAVPLQDVRSETIERRFRELMIEAPGNVGTNLVERIGDRLRGQEPKRRSETAAQVGDLSALQLDILRMWFGRGELGRIKRAYEWFAAGDLFLRPIPIEDKDAESFSNGGPNSINAMCFAEFALLAIEMDVDARAWKRLLPALVAVQEIFPHAYGKVCNGVIQQMPADEYSPGSAFNRAHPLGCPRPPTEEVRDAIRAKYARMTYEDLRRAAGENLRRALSSMAFAGFVPTRSALT